MIKDLSFVHRNAPSGNLLRKTRCLSSVRDMGKVNLIGESGDQMMTRSRERSGEAAL